MSILAIILVIPVIASLLAFTVWAERGLALSEPEHPAIGGLTEGDNNVEAVLS